MIERLIVFPLLFCPFSIKIFLKEVSYFLNNILYLFRFSLDFPVESTYLTNLVKPIRGKRDASMITPESTINFEGAYDPTNNQASTNKTQRIDEEVTQISSSKMEE